MIKPKINEGIVAFRDTEGQKEKIGLLLEEISLVVQDIVCSKGEVIGGEVLSRLNGVTNIEEKLDGISIYEKVAFDWNVIECFFQNIDAFLLRYKKLHLNLFSFTLKDLNFEQRFESLIVKYDITPQQLSQMKFEIIEKGYLKEETGIIPREYKVLLDQINVNIQYLQEKNIKIGLDDFPLGNTRFLIQHLTMLDFVKIDKKFLIEENHNYLIVIINLIAEIRKQYKDISITIEGVEDARFLSLGTKIGIESFQGYAFAKPHPL